MTPDGAGTRGESDVETLKAELEAERRHAAELEARNAAFEAEEAAARSQARKSRRHRRGRRFGVVALLVIGFVLTPITILTLFVHTEITDTGRYVSTVKPLASDPAIQAYTADRVTNRLFAQADVSQYVSQALPERAQPLVGPLTSGIKSFTHEAVLRLLQSKAFQTIWVEANRTGHATLNAVLTGKKTGAVTANTNGAVTVDLSAVAQKAKQRLESTGINVFSKIPADKVSGKVTIFESKDLYKVRNAVGALNKIAYLLPFLVFGAFGGAIWLSANRRRGFIRAACVFTLGAGLLALVLAVGRGIYLDGATNNGVPHDAAAAVFDALVRLLHTSVRAVLALSIVVVVAAVFAGPSRLAVWFRGSARRAASWLGGESDRAGWGVLGANPFVVSHKGGIRVGIAVVMFAVLFRWDRPTPMVIFWLVVATLFLLALVEFFGREVPQQADLGPAT